MLLNIFKKLFNLIIGNPEIPRPVRLEAEKKFHELLELIRPDEISTDGREVKAKWKKEF